MCGEWESLLERVQYVALRYVCLWEQGGSMSAVCVCVSTCSIYIMVEASECTKDGVNPTVKLVAACDKVLCGEMMLSCICTYCPKGMFSVCF